MTERKRRTAPKRKAPEMVGHRRKRDPLKQLADMKPEERDEFVKQFNALRSDDVERLAGRIAMVRDIAQPTSPIAEHRIDEAVLPDRFWNGFGAGVFASVVALILVVTITALVAG